MSKSSVVRPGICLCALFFSYRIGTSWPMAGVRCQFCLLASRILDFETFSVVSFNIIALGIHFERILPSSHRTSEVCFCSPSFDALSSWSVHSSRAYLQLRNQRISAVLALQVPSLRSKSNLPRKWIVGSLDRCLFGTLFLRFVHALVLSGRVLLICSAKH